MRSFLALLPDQALAEAIDAWNVLNWPAEPRRVPIQNLHITLQFLGEINHAQYRRIEEELGAVSFDPFSLRLDCFGFWPDSGLTWLAPSVTSDELNDLQRRCRALAQHASVAAGSRRFRPHMTLARRAGQGGVVPPPLIAADFEMSCSEIVLLRSVRRSHGPVYDIVASSGV